MVRKIGAERPLPYDLDQDVNDCRNNEREISGSRNCARRILYFAARNQRHLDSDERKNQ